MPLPPWPLTSTGHSQRHRGSRLGAVLFVIDGVDLHVRPLAPGQLFTAREPHLCPRWISPPTTSRQKKMSLLPWWCQVMDFMFARGVQVKNLEEAAEGDLHSQSILYQSCVQTHRLPWGSIKGESGAPWFRCQTCFVCRRLLLWAL